MLEAHPAGFPSASYSTKLESAWLASVTPTFFARLLSCQGLPLSLKMVRLPLPSSIRRAASLGEQMYWSASRLSPEARWVSPASLGLSAGHDMILFLFFFLGGRVELRQGCFRGRGGREKGGTKEKGETKGGKKGAVLFSKKVPHRRRVSAH